MYLNWNLRKSVACEQIFGGADGGTAKHIGRALDDTSFKKLSAWLRSFLPRLSATESVLGVRQVSRQPLQGSFSAVSKRKFASECASESSHRDLDIAPLCSVPKSEFFLNVC